jgi:hypothetical protein
MDSLPVAPYKSPSSLIDRFAVYVMTGLSPS